MPALQPIWISFAVAIICWIAANVVLLRVLRQVNRHVPIAEQPIPAAHNPKFCYALWKQHRSFYPGSSLRSTLMINYVACGLALLTGFALLLTRAH